MKISVVTPVFNGERFVKDAVESVLSQRGPFELEHIVCDGGSTDRTLETLRPYEGRIKLVSGKDRGAWDAINKGMAMASGEIGCWLNADDLFMPGALSRVAGHFSSHPESLWCYGRCIVIDSNGAETRKPITLYKNLLGYFYSRNVLLCENFINQPSTFWRMDLWRSVGGLASAYKAAWDYELWLKMSDFGPAFPIREVLSSFRRHPGSISESSFQRQFAEELEIASARGNAIHRLIHAFNCWKIVTAYKLMS